MGVVSGDSRQCSFPVDLQERDLSQTSRDLGYILTCQDKPACVYRHTERSTVKLALRIFLCDVLIKAVYLHAELLLLQPTVPPGISRWRTWQKRPPGVRLRQTLRGLVTENRLLRPRPDMRRLPSSITVLCGESGNLNVAGKMSAESH